MDSYILALGLVFWVTTNLIDWLGIAEPTAKIIKVIIAVIILLCVFGVTFGVGPTIRTR